MSEIICQTVHLNKSYQDTHALEDVNFILKKGEIYGLIGENGAGKTTLIKILAGIIFPTSGEIELLGSRDPKKLNRKRCKIGFTIENPAIYDNMTARQNMEIQCIQKGMKDLSDIDEILSQVELSNTGNKKAKMFSLGMKQRLALGIALIGKPELLILDEPVNGLDPIGIIELRELLIKLNKESGITILISSHILSELHKLVTSYGIMHKGKLIRQITADELDEQCEQYIYLKVRDVKTTELVLKNDLGINDYKVSENNVIKLFNTDVSSAEINKVLIQNDILVDEVAVKTASLETYFFNIVGGR